MALEDPTLVEERLKRRRSENFPGLELFRLPSEYMNVYTGDMVKIDKGEPEPFKDPIAKDKSDTIRIDICCGSF